MSGHSLSHTIALTMEALEGELRRLVNRTGGFISKSEIGASFATKVTRILERIKSAPPNVMGS